MGSALFICDVFLGKDKQASSTLDPTHTLSLTPHSHYPFLYHEYPRATLSVYAFQCHGWEHGSTLKTRPPTFSTRIYSCSSTAVARFLQLRKYSLYVAYIQRCRSFDNPHPPPSRYSRISYILPISPKWGGRRARFRSSALFPPATRDR